MNNKWEARIGWVLLSIGIVLIDLKHDVKGSIGVGVLVLGAMFVESSKYKKDKTS